MVASKQNAVVVLEKLDIKHLKVCSFKTVRRKIVWNWRQMGKKEEDFALGASGCKAVVEGFYSVVKIQKHAGGQSNDVLMEHSVVDWVLHHPIASPEIVEAIAKIYIKGDEKKGLKSHRQTKFFDPAGRAARKYETSKVVDRLRREKTLFIDFIL